MKPIKGYEERYSATEDGNIFSHITGKNLKPRALKNGYLRVQLVDMNGKITDFLIHRIICATFHPDGCGDVNHIDCNKANNKPDNLEWCTKKENMRHASTHGLLVNQSKHISQLNKQRCSVSVCAIDKVGNKKIYSSMAEAEREGYFHSQISRCISGERKTYKGLKWIRF